MDGNEVPNKDVPRSAAEARVRGDEIEVTPAMIEAGVDALNSYDNARLWCSDERLVENVFKAMWKVR